MTGGVPFVAFGELGEGHATYQPQDMADSLRSGGGGPQKATLVAPETFIVHGEHSTAMTGNGKADVAFPAPVARCLDATGGYATNQGGTVVMNALNAGYGKKSPRGDANEGLIAFDPNQVTSWANRSNPRPGEPCHTLPSSATPPAIAFNWQSGGDCRIDPNPMPSALSVGQVPAVMAFQERGRDGGPVCETQEDMAYALTAPKGGGRAQERNIATPGAVRRLTPRECERLMGWPDDWTRFRFDGRELSDGPRYRLCGNGVVGTVAEWLARRLMQYGL